MFLRIDAQHGFLPPAQGPDWYARILSRNRFEGSVRLAAPGLAGVAEALAEAGQHAYIRRVVPNIAMEEIDALPVDPLITSVRIDRNPEAAVHLLAARGLALEAPSGYTGAIHNASIPVAFDGMPAEPPPPGCYIKLTGFRLPASEEQTHRLRMLLRDPGPDRLMFASGWPTADITWKETLAAFTQSLGAMPIPLRERLLGGTAAEFYRLQTS